VTIGLGIDSGLLKDEILKMSVSSIDSVEKLDEIPSLFDCKDEVLASISKFALKFMPKNMTINCIKVSRE
jgi:hypothetical protein